MEMKLIRKLVKYKLQEIDNIEDFLVNYLSQLSDKEKCKFFEVDERIVSKKYKIYYPPNYPGRIFLVESEDEIYILGWANLGYETVTQYHRYKHHSEGMWWWRCKNADDSSIVCCPQQDKFNEGYLNTINPVGEIGRIPENFEEAELLLKAYEHLWENW